MTTTIRTTILIRAIRNGKGARIEELGGGPAERPSRGELFLIEAKVLVLSFPREEG